MKIFFLVIAILMVSVLAVFLSVWLFRRVMVKRYNIFLNKVDEILAGKKIELSYDESYESAISQRLLRIMDISRMNTERAEEERDTVKSLISNISHQIRTPLANITLYTGLLKEKLEEKEQKRLADKVESNAEKLEFFMNELIKSSYAEQDMISVNPVTVELGYLLEKSCRHMEPEALKKDISFICKWENCIAFADPRWTEEVFINILENAIKYSPTGSSVKISSISYDSFVCIRFEDSGIGIPEEEQGMIFRRFYRGSNVTDKHGFGIGLYLSREVLRKQKGYIKVKSSVGKGTAVDIFLLK